MGAGQLRRSLSSVDIKPHLKSVAFGDFPGAA
jgi:hypothetical protein